MTSIGERAFYKCTGLTSITIGNSVTSIGYFAFRDCSQLKTVINLSNFNITEGSVGTSYVAYYADKVIKADTQIDDFFFEDRTDGNYLVYYIGNETELTLPENYQGGGYNVGESVFSNYSKLTNIIIPESVTSIGNSAFSGCSGLTNITIPNSATSIGDGAFKGCTGLTSITIPENVTSIGIDAFCGCNNLTSIVWNVKSYPDPTSYEESPFYSNIGTIQEITFGEGITSIPIYLCKGMSNLKTVTFPQSLTSIRHYAFEGCTTLRIITLPENVKGIGHNAFSGCTKMRQIYCRSQEPPVCGNSALDGIDTWDCTLFVPEGAEALYKAADQWKEFFFIEEITGIDTPKANDSKDTTYDIYDMSGKMVRKAVTTTDGLKAGLYIINGRKVLVE